MGHRSTTATMTAARGRLSRGLGFRRRLGLAVGALALVVGGLVLLVGGGRPQAEVALSRGELVVGLVAIFLLGLLVSMVLAWLMAGPQAATTRHTLPPAPGTRAALRASRSRTALGRPRQHGLTEG